MANKSVNRVILIGNLTRDPELKYTPSGTPVCTFGVATNRTWITSKGERKDDVQYHRITAWQKLAELCTKILTKGKRVYLEGRLTYRTFTGKDGTERSLAEIILEDFVVFNNDKKTVEVTSSSLSEEETLTSSATSSTESAEEEEVFFDEPPVEPEEEESAQEKSAKEGSETREKSVEEKINPDDIPF
ncbi:MAG: single-stranded DNA-binding protein [Patescibacteria group bacterium]|nr:single-stranded DNA-binding protein [Patescibacteria group bacterium]